MNQIAIL